MLREIHKTERKQQILGAARRLIRKKGFTRMSMRELAKEARVSLVTPYNLFGSKANVLCALLESFFEKLETALDEIEPQDPIAALYALTQFSVKEYARDPAFYRSLLLSMVTTGELLPVPRIVQRCTTLWQRGLDAGIAQGLFQPHTRPDLVARQIQVNYRGAMELWLEGGVDIEGFETQLLYGLSLCLLAVATEEGRPRLLGRLRDIEQQLDRLTQNWTIGPDDQYEGGCAMKNGATTNGNGTRWHDKYPHLGKDPLPAEVFTSAEQFELEREHIFKKVWLNIGRVEQIPHPGDYFVQDLAVCNTSVIVVRSKDGTVKAFHNMCSHRGNKIAWDKQGTCRMFSCKFHGWSYALDGKLTFVPDEKSFFDLKKETLGMTPVAVDVWEGFIFINVDPNPQETLREYLGELGAGLTGYPFGELSATSTAWTTEVKANWKVIKDAFQEVYHIAFLHRRSIPDSFTSKANPYAHSLDVRLYPRHGSMSLYGNADLKPTPVADLAFRYGAFVIRKDFSDSRLPPAVNPTRSKEWSLDLNVIFPAFFVDVSEGSYFTHQFMPIAVDRTLWTSTQYFPKAKTPGQRFSQEYGNVIFRDVILEDGRTFEETQSVLSSGAKKVFYVHDEEILVRHSHRVIDQIINGRPVDAVSHADGKEEAARA